MDDQWHLRASVLTMLLALPIPSIAYGCGQTEFSELSGSISSVNYPSQYANSINCTYSIRSPSLYQPVLIGFTDFDTEECCDKVEIWCSTSVSSRRTFSGRNRNLSFFELPSCNVVKVNFRTDGSAVGRGFHLVFYWLISACGQTEFHDPSGFIYSPNYPNSYSSGTSCTYSIRSPGYRESLFIGFTDISTEECCDKVEIWCSANASTKRTFSGQHTSYSSLTLPSCNEIKVNFRTDGSVVERGFKLLFYWFNSGCGRTEFSEQSGYVSSPNYPLHYSGNVNCTYSIRSPGPHQSVFVGFTDFDTEAVRDTVQIWCSTNVTRILSFSGRYVSLSSFTLQTCKDVKISFRTDYYSIQGRGFKLLFYWTLPNEQTTISSPTTEPTSMSSIQTETEGLHDTSDNILAALGNLGAKTLSLMVVVFASLLAVGVFVIILVSIIFATRRLKRRKNATKTRLEVRGTVDTRGCSNDGYSLEPISTRRRPESVEYEMEEADYEQMDPPNDNDEDDDEYQNVDGCVR